MSKPWDYNKIMSDKKLFHKTVYTPLSEAIKILEERQKNKELIKKIEKLLNNKIPEPFSKLNKYGVSTKQIATPNHDTKWFVKLTKEFGLRAVFSEYYDDKFTSNNGFKHSLGQIHICSGVYKNEEDKFEKMTILDFNKYNGKKLKNIFTFWNQPLIDFHRELFAIEGLETKDLFFFDASEWLKILGGKAEKYYEKDLLLYICHGILFENYITTGKEGEFTKKILLPAIKNVIELTGLKPLIVPIPPMDIEEDLHWISYTTKVRDYIKLETKKSK